jgi:hypothetical protein
VARTPRLSQEFLQQRSALGIRRHTPESRALTVVIVALSRAESLPEPGDATTLLEPDKRGVSALVHVRRVPGHNLWVFYRERPRNVLELARIANQPPG